MHGIHHVDRLANVDSWRRTKLMNEGVMDCEVQVDMFETLGKTRWLPMS